jgi:opacity protein-like surface antigen
MKSIYLSAALLVAISASAMAGTEMAPSGKDMKDMKQMAPSTSDAGFYVAAYGGVNFDTYFGDKHQTLGGAKTNEELRDTWAGVGGIKAGYNFQSMDEGFVRLQPALEAEGIYIGDNVHGNNTFGAGAIEHLSTNSGDFFINGILRFKNSSIITPYIGGGIGLQYITTHGNIGFRGGPQATGLDTSDLDFAGQGIFGLDVAVCQHISLFTEYKFIDAIGTDGHNSGPGTPGGATYRFKPDQLEQNLITAGVKYTF